MITDTALTQAQSLINLPTKRNTDWIVKFLMAALGRL